jgi:hypothetical protein
MQERVREKDAPDGRGQPLPQRPAGAGRKAAGTCHLEGQNGATQGKAA